MKVIFSDFHGCYEKHPEIWDKVDALVTGASWKEYASFMERKVGHDIPIYFYPGKEMEEDPLKIANFKAEIINRAKVTVYYEDNPEQIMVLKALCPDTEIVPVKDGETII